VLRLTTRPEEGGQPVVYLAGRISVSEVVQLETLRAGPGEPLLLDLSQVISADDAGIATLRTLRRQGAQLRAASPYLRLLIEAEDLGAG
jgi:hypothetical protein